MIRHRVANLCLIDHNFKNPNFLIFNRNLLKLSLTCFSHFSTPIKTNLISGWTFPLILVKLPVQFKSYGGNSSGN